MRSAQGFRALKHDEKVALKSATKANDQVQSLQEELQLYETQNANLRHLLPASGDAVSMSMTAFFLAFSEICVFVYRVHLL